MKIKVIKQKWNVNQDIFFQFFQQMITNVKNAQLKIVHNAPVILLLKFVSFFNDSFYTNYENEL